MTKKRFGWLPDLPDHRDKRLSLVHIALTSQLPDKVDLRDARTQSGAPVMPAPYDQLDLGACTSNAIAGAFEFAQRTKRAGYDFMPSRLFIYYNERVLEDSVNEDAGAFIRDGFKSINAQGVCTENQWKYNVAKFATKPRKPCYTSAEKHQAMTYQRVPRDLTTMRSLLANHTPFVFGFTVYESFESDEVARTGVMPMPTPDEQVSGGHAVLAVGYDLAQRQFIARNSWGDSWGDGGYFRIPFAYLMNEDLSDDFWAITSIETR